MSKPENPSAFPENRFEKCGDVAIGHCQGGMTLRDYFAAKIIAVTLSYEKNMVCLAIGAEHQIKSLATDAYVMADAMLVVRQSADHPECSGDPKSCPENEGNGCCEEFSEKKD